jgi:ribonuclease HI
MIEISEKKEPGKNKKRPFDFRIYTDGGFDPVTRIGSWAYVIKVKCEKKRFKFVRKSGVSLFDRNLPIYTEIQAALQALKFIEKSASHEKAAFVISSITIYTDNKQVSSVDSMVRRYEEAGWKYLNSNEDIYAGLKDAWIELKNISDRLNVKYQWIRAHNGNVANELCDLICTTRINQTKKEIYYTNFITGGE